MIKKFVQQSMLIIGIITFISCSKKSDPVPTPLLATIVTSQITSIEKDKALGGGEVSSDNGFAVTAKGIVWSTSSTPTIALSTKTVDGSGVGVFSSNITNLSPNTTYYVRGYATNKAGTIYGGEKIFTTLLNVGLPTLITSPITAITSTSANTGGNITSDNNGPILSRGIVWSTSTSPTIALSTKTTNGTGIGTFTTDITGLSPNTKYFIRSYATNIAGTSYGEEISFTTSINISIPTLSTVSISAIGNATAQSGGNISSANNGAIISRGVVWSTSPTPAISLTSKTSDGNGINSYVSNITGLTQNTRYYVRAYATNSAGTAYGNELSFTTTANVNLSLDGKWQTSTGNGITISGTIGVYYSFSPSFLTAVAKGLVAIGTTTLKNIANVSSNKWNCLALAIYTLNGVPTQAIWSYNGTITMSTDGKTITVDSNFIKPDGQNQNLNTEYIRQ